MSWNNMKLLYDDKDGFVKIDSEEFNISYGNGYNSHGLQCEYSEGTEVHTEVLNHLDEIACRIRSIALLVDHD